MVAALSSILIVLLMIAIVRWVASVPLLRTLNCSIDQWADSVQGSEATP